MMFRIYTLLLWISFSCFANESFFKIEHLQLSLDHVEMRGVLSKFPAHLFHESLTTGFLEGNVECTGSPHSPSLKINLHFRDISLNEGILKNLSPFSGHCVLELKDEGCHFTGVLENPHIEQIAFNGMAPCTFSLFPFAFKLDEEQGLTSSIAWKGEMAPLIELFKGDNANLVGFADILLFLTGTLTDLHISGVAKVSNATYEIPETGALYKNIEALLTLQDTDLILKELTATDAFEGLIKGQGGLTLSYAENFPFNFDIEIEKTKLLRLGFAEATGNGLLKLTGNLSEGHLSGKVIAEEASVLIPEESSAVVHSVEVTYLNQDATRLPPTIYEPYKATWPIYLDLDFEVKKPFSIKGTGLTSKWSGGLKVKGSHQAPEIFGEFELIRGEYHFKGKVFDIKKGTIAFAGEPGKKSSLYVIGSHEAGNILAEVILKGPLKAPALSFRSNPPLPQREILSWILFGAASQELSKGEDVELNQSIKDLSSPSSSGADVLSKIRNTIGIDTLDINKEKEGNDVSIKVGKYISKGVLVSLNKGINKEVSTFALEAKIFKDLKLQAEVGDDREGLLNLKWKTDY